MCCIAFASASLRVDAPNIKGSAAPRITVARCRLTPEERKIIEMLERSRGRALTKEEIRLSLEQARAIGEL